MHIVIPVKRFAEAKGRLAGVLSAECRRELMRAMLEDLLDATTCVTGLGGIVIVSDEPELPALCKGLPVQLMAEPHPGDGLNANLTAALTALSLQGVTRALLLHADIPLVETKDIQLLVDTDRIDDSSKRTVLVPDGRNDGTNALICSLPLEIVLQYGERSFEKHRQQAIARGHDAVVRNVGALGLDIDSEGDLKVLLEHAQSTCPADTRRTPSLLLDWTGAGTLKPAGLSSPNFCRSARDTATGCSRSIGEMLA